MKLLLKYLKPFFSIMGIGFGIKIFGTLVELALPYILSHILKNVVVTQSLQQILFWGVMMIVCAAVACISNVKANRMAARVARNFSESIRHDLFDRTMRLSAAQTDLLTIPSLESRITTDTYNVHNFVNMMQRMGVRAPIMLSGGIAITLIMDSYLAIAMLATLPLIFLTVFLISGKGVPLYSKVQKSVDNMVRVVREDTQGIRVIKALSKNKYEHARYDRVNKLLVKDEKKAGITMSAVNPVMTLLMNMGIVAVIALSANRVANHQSDPETVIAFIQYFTQISMAMMALTRIFVMYTKSSASAKRIEEVLQTEKDLTIKDETLYPHISTEAYLKFDHVCFSYNGVKNDIQDISFEIKKGQSLGIIGATGSGKSTIIKLLLRFYDADNGNIYIDGRNIRTVPPEELYSIFGAAMQNDFLCADTISENIRFGRKLSEKDIEIAAETAQAADFIANFPEGYDHMLSQKGTNISGGQKQRILVARAVATKPKILLLDDSSSALDYKTDAALRRALSEKMQGSTIVTVAQRVSSVMSCDLILVIDEGKIIGVGTHAELIESCADYREISESQLGGGFVE